MQNGLNGAQTKQADDSWRLSRYDPEETVNVIPGLLARERGRDEAVQLLNTFIPYTIRNDPAVLDATIQKAEERYQRLQELESEYNVSLTPLFDEGWHSPASYSASAPSGFESCTSC